MSLYYLELNPLISLGKKISLLKGIDHHVYTSIWALGELLIQLNEINFKSTKSRLDTILSSEIAIDWEEPMEIIYKSFRVRKRPLEIAPVIRQIIADVLKCQTLSEFETKYPNSFVELVTYMQTREIAHKTIGRINAIITTFANRVDFARLESYRFEEIYVNGLSKYIADQLGVEAGMVLAEYTGRLHWYLACLKMTVVNMAELDKNDYLDIEHLCYVQNNITYVVSNDSIYKRLGYGKSIDFRQFMKKIGIGA